MSVCIRFFAAARERVGRERIELTIEHECTISDLIERLGLEHGEAFLSALSAPGSRVAVNQELVDVDHPVRDGDEVAFLPRVTGG